MDVSESNNNLQFNKWVTCWFSNLSEKFSETLLFMRRKHRPSGSSLRPDWQWWCGTSPRPDLTITAPDLQETSHLWLLSQYHLPTTTQEEPLKQHILKSLHLLSWQQAYGSVFLLFEDACFWLSVGSLMPVAETHSDILGSGLDQTAAAHDKHRCSVHFVVSFVPQPVFISLFVRRIMKIGYPPTKLT